MKRILIHCLFVLAVLPLGSQLNASGPAQPEVTHVVTALDHLTVLEFDEPVTMAAAGSSSFQIEWKDNKVFVKPLKANAATDLFVWTATRRFNYELQASGEVATMNFAIDNRRPEPQPTPTPSFSMAEVADTLLTRAFMGAEPIDSSYIKDKKGRVIVRIQQIFESSNGLYIRYSIRNLSDLPYRALTPELRQLTPFESHISIVPLQRLQLDDGTVKHIGAFKQTSISLAHADSEKQDLAPGEETQGVLVVRQQFPKLTVLELGFGPEGGHHVRAVFVR